MNDTRTDYIFNPTKNDVAFRIFTQIWNEKNLLFSASGKITVSGYNFTKFGEVINNSLKAIVKYKSSSARTFIHNTSVVWIGAEVTDIGYDVEYCIAATTMQSLTKTRDYIEHNLPKHKVDTPGKVSVTFWTYGSHGPERNSRKIDTPVWETMAQNYTDAIVEKLDDFLKSDPANDNDFTPEGGQLILWHGDSGTGKTYALRALADKWKEWCDIHYIVDPDVFFGANSDYLMEVLLSSEWSDWETVAGNPGPKEDKWRLLVLEDTGELLHKDAKLRTGQGLSRLLNVVDGFIGQGLKILILVTTNEEMGKLHEAVVRPGRCLSIVKFSPLTSKESDLWRKDHKIKENGKAATVAQLYAELRGEEEEESQTAAFGFAS